MTTGIQTKQSSRYVEVLLLSAEEATAIPLEAAKSAALSATPDKTKFFDLTKLQAENADLSADCEILVENVGGTGVVSAVVRLWCYSASTGKAYPWGIGADAVKGTINGGASMGATDTDKLRHREIIPGPGLADGIQAQIVSSTGTGTETFNVRILFPLKG